MNFNELQALLPGTQVFARSLRSAGGETYAWAKDAHQHYFLVVYNPQLPPFQRDTFSGEVQDFSLELAVKWCLPSTSNARKLRALFPWTAPRPLGDQQSFGCGDELGLANVAHIRAARECGLGDEIGLVLAQRSVQEMAQLGRRPDEVLDAATWAVFAEGWRHPWGANADELRTVEDARRMAQAGFSTFTIDASPFVDEVAEVYSEQTIQRRIATVDDLHDVLANCKQALLAENGTALDFSELEGLRAIVTYHHAVAQVAQIARAVEEVCGSREFEIEVSFSEITFPRSPFDQTFVALELKRLGVANVVSFALRLCEYEDSKLLLLSTHMAEYVGIARKFNYGLAVYLDCASRDELAMMSDVCGDTLRLKTLTTWWFAALRTLARTEPRLFEEIAEYARLSDGAPKTEAALDSFEERDSLYVAFPALMNDKDERGRWRFRDRIYRALLNGEVDHHVAVEEEMRRMLQALNWCAPTA